MTKEEAIKRLRNESCKSRLYCELYPDACMKEECEIYMAIEALQRTSNALPTHECVKATHECVEPVGNSDQLNRTCAECKYYTEEHLCVFWSYFGFEPNDCCSRWERKGADDE